MAKKTLTKNVFALCDTGNGIIAGEEFITAKISEDVRCMMDKDISSLEKQIHKGGHLPVFVIVLELFLFVVGFVVLIDKPVLFLIIFMIVYLGTSIWDKLRIKKLDTDLSENQSLHRLTEITHTNKWELGVPDDAEYVDVLTYSYKLKNGKEKRIKYRLGQFLNMSYQVYQQNDCLCFSDPCQVVSIPYKQIIKCEIVSKRISFWGWNKEEGINSKRYKNFKLRTNQYGTIYVKEYGRLVIAGTSETYEIIIPNYDMEEIYKLIKREKT